MGNMQENGYAVGYIPIDNEKIPYMFDIKLEDRTYTSIASHSPP